MKKRECIDLNPGQDMSKYKFIPPSKLIKAKETISSKSNHFYSLMEVQHDKTKPNEIQPTRRATKPEENNQNDGFINKKIFEIQRSLSNPKLTSSSSRNAILKQKNPPIENYKRENVLAEKHVYEHNEQWRGRQKLLKDQISLLAQQNKDIKSQNKCVRQENKLLREKLERINTSMALKNKQITDLHEKTKQLQAQAKQKNQQNSLIIESLKKVIESQIIKINELNAKNAQNKSKFNEYFPQTILADKCSFVNQETNCLQLRPTSLNSSTSNIESLLYEEDIPKPRTLLHVKEHMDEESQQLFDYTGSQQTLEIEDMIGQHKIQFPTPNFGARTPQDSLVKPINIAEDKNNVSFSSEVDQYQENISLSRISESVEQYIETDREHKKPQPTKVYRHPTKNDSTHQRLLDEIDEYLSKRTKLISK